ncbi:MAG TPA: MBL fold metallo-hydrolase [Spirochaetota bacterium]|nr:MBL fold metallo-hydrolase [Spirochaetota bacterium]HPF05514.1 MBL fold metallo-hydrolase [Spirochaetota bacterium]HPJ41371.1 MBL fold metallo-hydrolase [Spirochaetota bacterium]HPR38379.1 MBL fold metallo-hydrolase [Spirochaetota bacterium]HRX47690.1 MBL fold metallo-hydrolase [Spirochaetota bacterium]
MKIHKLKGYINTLFIAEYEDYLLLLDGGSPADVELIENYCQNVLHRPVSNIRLAVVTHMHPDHSGAAPILRKKYGTRIAAYKNIDQWYSGPTGWFQHKLDCLMAQIVAMKQKTKIRKVFSKRITGPDYLVHDMEPLPFFYDWRVIYTPGHTSHDIAVYNEEMKILYCGDSIIEVRGRFYLPLPVIFRRRMKNSYRKMGELGAEQILIPHGNCIDTADSRELFSRMEKLLEEPPNRIRRRVHYFSVWSPAIWKPTIRRLLFQ